MTAILHPVTPQQARERLDAGRAILVDIREADEFANKWTLTHEEVRKKLTVAQPLL